ncbi:MAG: hypothetical protein ACI9KE_006642 [Polyangiales bacterium]|jgi:hypothetical protein
MSAFRLLGPALLVLAASTGACDCAASHPPADAALDVSSDSAVADTTRPVDASVDVHLVCGWEPTPECATESNSSLSLTLGDSEATTLELDFGYLSYNRGFDYSMSFLFMESGDADRCSAVQLQGRIIPNAETRNITAGVHEVYWVLSYSLTAASHSFTTSVMLTSANDDEFGGPVGGSIVDVVEVDELILEFSGAFEMNECEAWATSGS